MDGALKGRVLSVAGSDPSGGAGIQADIKTISALGAYAATAITAITIQNSLGVSDVHAVDKQHVEDQLVAVLDDIGADCIKTGMLLNREILEVLISVLSDKASGIPLVTDPVLVSSSGKRLLNPGALDLMKGTLFPRITVLTPNIPEACALTGMEHIQNDQQQIDAGLMLLDMGVSAVVIKGGHGAGDECRDLLMTSAGPEWFVSDRIDSKHTHGTGCTFASAIATGLAQELSVSDSVARAHKYVAEAIRIAPGYGAGHGPLNHHVILS